MHEIRCIDEAIESLYDLNVGVIGTGAMRHERPHKPLLLLAAMDLIACGNATPERIPWKQNLRSRFSAYFDVVRRVNDQNTPENPFFHLKNEGFWQPFEIQSGNEYPLGNTPTISQANQGNVFARIHGGLERFLREPECRMTLRRALLSRYFPNDSSTTELLFQESSSPSDKIELLSKVAEPSAQSIAQGRSSAFRRKLLQVYDFQCAACGLRIKLPDAGLTFVDGAHIIPFEESHNDHPTNGLALCKNHHWAMDRFLLVPTPEGSWKSSPRLDARRSPGESDLVALNGKSILPPHEDAFRPDPASLRWRAERLR